MKPAILQTFRKDGSPYISPVWFREHGGAFEIVIAEGDPKLSHLRRDPRCTFMAFDAEPPFAGVKVVGEAELIETDVTEQRAAISGRYLGEETGRRFAESRTKPGVLVRITAEPRRWDLRGLLEPPYPQLVERSPRSRRARGAFRVFASSIWASLTRSRVEP